MSERSYTYSPIHRWLEIVSIFALWGLLAAMAYEVSLGLRGPFAAHAWYVVVGSLVVGYLAADFVSGFVHFMGDTFGDESTPILGRGFIKPFREHHVDPRGMTRHDFIETNGNNCAICVPTALGVWWLLPARTEIWATYLVAFTVWFMVWIFMTNQFHKWSHLEEPPRWISVLQQWRLILSPDHHQIHHTPPFDKYYCITTGWLNPILYKLRFFYVTEAVLRWIFRTPKGGSDSTTEPAGG